MLDRSELAQEKKALLEEVRTIETNANAQIEAIQREAQEEIKPQKEKIEAIHSEAQEELKPKTKRVIEINNLLLKSIDEEAGISND